VEIGSRCWGILVIIVGRWGLCVILSELAGLDVMCGVWSTGLRLFELLIVGASWSRVPICIFF